MIKRKILIVEDDEQTANLIATILTVRNFDVEMAHTGADGIEKLQNHPDLVILDRSLPDIDGLDICRKIRENKRISGTPVVVLSAKNTSEDKIEGLYIGADDYITKPFQSEEFIARLEVVLRRIQFSDQLKGEREGLIDELNRILEEDLLTVFFQPIFSLQSFKPIGFEVLSRAPKDSPFNNPEFLFKVAYSCGMYFDLEMTAWKKAFEKWNQSEKAGKLFLNCSPYIIESGLFNKSIFEKGAVPPRDIVLELTERIAIQDYDVLLEKFDEFRKMDLGIAVDDVGSGFASLNTVAEIKPDFLKIDMPLIRSINTDMLKQDIAQAIVDFSRKHNIVTIAEGIETKDELSKVLELGVDAGQGYLLARPQQEIVMNCAVLLD